MQKMVIKGIVNKMESLISATKYNLVKITKIKYFISFSPIVSRYPYIILLLLSYIVFLTGTISAQTDTTSDTRDEESMFGADADTTGKTDKTSTEDEDGVQTHSGGRDAFASGEVVNNPLQIGGTIYYRFIASPQVDGEAKETPISLPLQVDAFLDGRPNDRIRVFVNARLLYDATRDEYSQTTSGTNLGSAQTSSTASVFTSDSSIPNNPQIVLDQAWLKFDIARAVFLTGGSQHVKWGTARFWNPTDFLHLAKRDPLLQYDLRLGQPMLKADVPLQFMSSNFTVIALWDQPDPSSTIGQLGAAARFESVIGSTEIGIDAVYKTEEDIVIGADFSAPLGPFDIYAEAACFTKAKPHYNFEDDLVANRDLAEFFSEEDLATPYFQVSGGLNFTFGWLENRQAVIGVEYFYNQAGYENSAIYPVLILKNAYEPFYLGQHYAAFYLSAEGPDAAKRTSYILSVLSNLSDLSFTSRLDFSWRFLTYLTLEVFISGHFGSEAGEFNFSLDTPAIFYNGAFIPEINVPATLLDTGLALRTRF